MLVRWLDIARGIILDTDVRAIRTYTSRPVPQRYIILAELPTSKMYAGRSRCLKLLLLLLILLSWNVNGSVEGCTSNFINLESLISQSLTLSYTETGQYLYPSINFTCNGSITGWSVLSVFYSSFRQNELYPDLQVWRGEGGGAYTRVGNTTLSQGSGDTSLIGIREYTLETPLEFQTGDIFGIFQPQVPLSRLRVSHEQLHSTPTVILINTNGAVEPPNSTLHLAINSGNVDFARVHISVLTDQPQCVNGFLSNETLQSVSLQRRDGVVSFFEIQSVSPNTSFTCDGNVTKWIMRWIEIAETINNRNITFPELQVWRPSNEANATFQLVGSTTITADSRATRAIAIDVYEFTVDPPLPVLAGDVLGIYQPESRITLYFGAEKSNEVLYQSAASSLSIFPEPPLRVLSHSRFPLISAEVVATSISLTTAVASLISLTTTSSVVSTTTSMSPRPTDDASFPVAGVAAGGVGALVALAGLAVLVIVAVVMCRKRRRERLQRDDCVIDKEFCQNSNPAYGVTNHEFHQQSNSAYGVTNHKLRQQSNSAHGAKTMIDYNAESTADYVEVL